MSSCNLCFCTSLVDCVVTETSRLPAASLTPLDTEGELRGKTLSRAEGRQRRRRRTRVHVVLCLCSCLLKTPHSFIHVTMNTVGMCCDLDGTDLLKLNTRNVFIASTSFQSEHNVVLQETGQNFIQMYVVCSGGAGVHGGHGDDHRQLQPSRQQDEEQIQQHPGL